MPSYDRVRACPCLPMSESPLSVHVRALGLERLPPACISGETSVSPVRVCATVSLACGCVADHAYLPVYVGGCPWWVCAFGCMCVCVCQRRSRLTCVRCLRDRVLHVTGVGVCRLVRRGLSACVCRCLCGFVYLRGRVRVSVCGVCLCLCVCGFVAVCVSVGVGLGVCAVCCSHGCMRVWVYAWSCALRVRVRVCETAVGP